MYRTTRIRPAVQPSDPRTRRCQWTRRSVNKPKKLEEFVRRRQLEGVAPKGLIPQVVQHVWPLPAWLAWTKKFAALPCHVLRQSHDMKHSQRRTRPCKAQVERGQGLFSGLACVQALKSPVVQGAPADDEMGVPEPQRDSVSGGKVRHSGHFGIRLYGSSS